MELAKGIFIFLSRTQRNLSISSKFLWYNTPEGSTCEREVPMKNARGVVFSFLVASVITLAKNDTIAAQSRTQEIVGEWAGQLINPAGGIAATIEFELTHFHGDTIHGSVVLVEDGREDPVEPDSWVSRPSHQERYDDLHVDFVEAEDGGVQGMLTPYRDSDCGCAMATTFAGTVSGDRIAGTYVAHHRGSGLDETGTWWVERR
jgi:hypothetical protein